MTIFELQYEYFRHWEKDDDLDNLPDWIKDLFLDCEEEGQMQNTQFEEPGDIEQLLMILKDGKFWDFTLVYNFVSAAQFICRPEDLYRFGKVKEFKTNYPAIYRTLEKWTWDC